VKTHPAAAPVVNRITGDSIQLEPLIIVPLTTPVEHITGVHIHVVKFGLAKDAYVFANAPPKDKALPAVVAQTAVPPLRRYPAGNTLLNFALSVAQAVAPKKHEAQTLRTPLL
jgi:hypothetical protein